MRCLLCLGTLVITALTVPGRPGRWVGRAFWSGGERSVELAVLRLRGVVGCAGWWVSRCRGEFSE